MKRLITIACLAALAGCAGDTDDAQRAQQEQREQWAAQNQSLIYSFPDEGQIEVPVSSPIVLRFSSPVVETAPEIILTEVGGDPVTGLDMEWVDNNRGMIITPGSNLKPMTDYIVDVPAIELDKGTAQARSIAFSTRALFEGPKSQLGTDTFEIIRMIPDGEQYQIMDFSSFRLQFSQPLDRSTARYGNSAESTVQLMGPNGLVDAHLLVSGRYMTIDPKSELTPGADYSLNITTGLASIYGDTLPGGSFGNPNDPLAVRFPITPQDTGAPGTGERVSMVQDVADTGEVSPLTGKPINLVPMASVLLGEDTATQASGTLAAELAFAPNFPDETPFRVKRGSLIEGASIDVRISGEVPAGFDSGDVRIEFLSDAVGYLLPNRYSGLDDVPRQVRLFMDVAVSTATPTANGAITQNLMHIELVGTSIVEDGQMVINAVGVVEPNVLGSERAKGLLSFYMKAFEDQDNPPVVGNHSTPPVLQSWSLGTNALTGENKALQAKPGDPVIFNFDQALDPESVAGNVRLFHNDTPMDIEYFADGSALVIKPAAVREESDEGTTITRPGFQLSPADAPNIYRVEVDGATNLAGDMAYDLPLVEEFELATILPDYDLTSPEVAPEFRTADYWLDRRGEHSPVILAVYPGFPCALQEEFIAAGGFTGLFDGPTDIGQTYRDLANGVAGVCAGGAPEITDGIGRDNRPADDAVPVMDMPANRPIIIAFGKEIDPATVVLGETLIVERIDEQEQPLGSVAGEMEISDMTLLFRPKEPWQEGELYRYTLKSSGWGLCPVGSDVNRFTYRLVANDDTEIEQCGRPVLANADYRNFECGLDAICDKNGLPLRTMPLAFNTMRKITNANAEAIRHYNWRTYGPSITAGGPAMTQFFRGAEPSKNVLQILRTQPVADTNRNFISERSNLGAADTETALALQQGIGGGSPDAMEVISAGTFSFDIEEYGPEGILMPGDAGFGLHPDYDPDGVRPAKNSAKILSRFDSKGLEFSLSGANVGCSYDSFFDPNTFESHVGDPFECPDNKFSYLISAAIAEVTDEVTEQGVKVKLWPSMVMGTSLDVYINTDLLGFVDYAAGTLTGPQVMRMRYSGSNRNQPIVGWISEQSQGAIMSMNMDLYLDAPHAIDWAPVNNPLDMISYPISMSLEGAVDFLDDGRMEVEQYNTNLINIDLELWSTSSGDKAGYMDLFIPEYGSRINMISEPIK